MLEATVQVPLDADLFPKYVDFGLRQEESHHAVDPDDERLKVLEREFSESGYRAEPDMTVDPGQIDTEGFLEKRRLLEDFQLYVTEWQPDDTRESWAVVDAYTDRTDFDIAMIDLVLAAANKSWPTFRQRNMEIFGTIDERIDAGVKDWFANIAAKARTDSRPEVKLAAERLLVAIGQKEKGQRRLIVPDRQLLDATRQRSWEDGGYMQKLLEGVEIPDGIITEKIGDLLVARMFQNMSANTKIVPGNSWNYHPDIDEMERPGEYSITSQEFPEYWGHETLHVVEAATAQHGPLLLAVTGLDRYAQGNEGSATIPEQIANQRLKDFTDERRWHIILARHLIVSLGSGMHGLHKPLSSPELYSVIRDAFFVYEASRKDFVSVEDGEARAHQQAWNLLSYVKSGTNGSAESGVIARPQTYLPGNDNAWRLERGSPGAYYRDSVGKIDRANTRHRRIMRDMGALAA